MSQKNFSPLLWAVSVALFLGLLIARGVYPEYLWLTLLLSVALIASLLGLARENQKALRSRTAAYGVNSGITVLLVIGIVGVVNFLASKHPFKLDLTKNKLHTLSDQTTKIIKGLDKPVKAVLFGKSQQREQYSSLFDDYRNLSQKFEVEYIDPDREPTRARDVGIKKYGTLQLMVGTRDTKIEEPTEEKITNALIKLLKEKSPTLCSITGHGEKNFSATDADGYSLAKKALNDQSYEVLDVSLIQGEAGNPPGTMKIPEKCDAIAILGPTKAFFAPEIHAIQTYLENGGRAVIATDINLKGGEYAPDLLKVLEHWYIKPLNALVVDPLSRMLGVDSSVAILASFSHDLSMTKDFQANCAFPMSRPLVIMTGAPASLNLHWAAQTTPKSWGVTDLSQLLKGQVTFTQGKDIPGPLTAVIAAEGKLKDSKATRNTRLVVYGSSFFANNNFSRFMGNMDFFLNSISWAMEDESLISIRAKEDTPGKVELSQKAGTFVFLLSVIMIPLLISAGGIAIWAVRRRL